MQRVGVPSVTVTLGEALRAGRTLRAPQPHPRAPVPCSPSGQEPCCAALALSTLCPFLGHTPDFLWVKCVYNACHLQSCFNPVCREVNRGSEGLCSHPAHVAQKVAEPSPTQGPHALLLSQCSPPRWPLPSLSGLCVLPPPQDLTWKQQMKETGGRTLCQGHFLLMCLHRKKLHVVRPWAQHIPPQKRPGTRQGPCRPGVCPKVTPFPLAGFGDMSKAKRKSCLQGPGDKSHVAAGGAEGTARNGSDRE